MNYFTCKEAEDIHAWVIEETGGMQGVKNSALLDSILTHIQNDCYYPNFEDKLTHLSFSIVQYHLFHDGNKRSAILLGALFLEINGLENITEKFIDKMENIVVWLAEGKISNELLKSIVSSIIYDDEYSEELALHLINNIQS